MADITRKGKIAEYFNDVIRKYDGIRGKDWRKIISQPFWDVVVITAADEDQKSVYTKQINLKQSRQELPLGLSFHVVVDPPGPKIGNGGSTFEVLSYLEEKYGSDLYKLRIFLIHAGGQSQRLPSASVLGKIFSPIPYGDPIYQMLDVKLAMYLPLVAKMCPGVFVTCADDFQVYDLGIDFESSETEYFSSSGFTALAHPSTLLVGVAHGVYVIKDIEKIAQGISVQKALCLEVLQKPTEEKMYKKGAVLQSENLSVSEVKLEENVVYTDSSFFFAHDISKKFVDFTKKHGMVTCEIDAYGDFLQALGPRATNDYINNLSNVGTITPSLLETRQKVFDLLKGTDLALLVMNSSRFIHIGTTTEYLRYFCSDQTFQSEMNLGKDVFNLWTTEVENSSGDAAAAADDGSPLKISRLSDTSLGCVMHSILPRMSFISETAVVEYCHFQVPVHVGQNTIISNCQCNSEVLTGNTNEISDLQNLSDTNKSFVEVPHNLFIHSVPVKMVGITKYATVFFDIKDNLKKFASKDDVKHLPFLGRTLEEYAEVVEIDPGAISTNNDITVSKINLWYSDLFPVMNSMSESFNMSLKLIKAVKTHKIGEVSLKDYTLVSMATILKVKDVVTMLEHRNEIFKMINSS